MVQAPIKGLFQWGKWGLVSPPANGLGLITGGGPIVDSDGRKRLGTGGNEMRRGGILKYVPTVSGYVTASNQALCALGLRASYPRGALSAFYLSGGADEWQVDYSACYVNEMTLTYAQGEGLRVDITPAILNMVTGAGSTMIDETNDDFEDYDFVVTFEGNEYHVQSFTSRIANTVTIHSSGNTKGAIKREALYIKYGAERLTLDLVTDIPIPHATVGLQDAIPPQNLGMVATGANGTNTLTLTWSKLRALTHAFPWQDADTDAPWNYSFDGSSKAGSLVWGWA